MARLLDHRGELVDLHALRREQAAPTLGGIRSIVGQHSLRGLTPQRLASILRRAETPGYGAAERYLDLAETMEERDLHYLGVLQTRRRQVAQLGVQIEPASDSADDVADADLVREFFQREAFEDEAFDLLDALGKGYSVVEIVWETSEGQWRPQRLEHRLPQWFDFDPETGARLMLRSDDGSWAPLPPWKFVTHISQAKSGLPIRGGLARIAAWAWLFKNLALKDWVRFVEAYGQPIRLGRFPPGATQEDRDELWRAVSNVAADAAALVPEGMALEFVDDPTVRGRSEIFRDLIGYIDDQLSVAILGQTLTTQAGERGSYALGAVHNLVRGDIERSDGRQLAATLRRDLVIPIVALNRGPRKAYPRLAVRREDPADIERLATALKDLVPLGLRVRMSEVQEMLGFAAPDDGDEVLAPQAPTPVRHPVDTLSTARRQPVGDLPAADRAGAETRARAATAAADPLAAVIDAIDADEWQELAAPLIEPILSQARSDPDGLLTDLAAAYPAMDADALTNRLARILFIADLQATATPSG